MSYRVFLSHNVHREDYSLVVQIANLLWQQGIEVHIPEWYPRYSEAVNREVAAQIDASNLVVAIATSATSRPTKMFHEMGYALGKGKQAVGLVEVGVNSEGFLHDVPRITFSRHYFEETAKQVVDYIYDAKQGKEQSEKAVWGLVLGGLFLWWLSQRGRPREDEQP